MPLATIPTQTGDLVGGYVQLDLATGQLVPDGELVPPPTGAHDGLTLGTLMRRVRASAHTVTCSICTRFLGAPHIVIGVNPRHVLEAIAEPSVPLPRVWLVADQRRQAIQDSQQFGRPMPNASDARGG